MGQGRGTSQGDRMIVNRNHLFVSDNCVSKKSLNFGVEKIGPNNFINSITLQKGVKIAIFASFVSFLAFFCNNLNIFSPTVLFWLGFDAAARLCLVLADESNIVVRQ